MSADRGGASQAVAVEETFAAAAHPASARPLDPPPATVLSDGDVEGTVPAPPDRRGRRHWLWLCAVLTITTATAAVLAAVSDSDSEPVEVILLDEPAPALNGDTLDGPPFSLADHRGEVVVVNVWASWCTVCKEEHPDLEAAARKLAPGGVQFVGLDTMDTVEDARTFLKAMGGS